MCAERLRPVLLPTAQHLAGCGELGLAPRMAELLAEASVSTVQRFVCTSLRQKRLEDGRLRRC